MSTVGYFSRYRVEHGADFRYGGDILQRYHGLGGVILCQVVFFRVAMGILPTRVEHPQLRLRQRRRHVREWNLDELHRT